MSMFHRKLLMFKSPVTLWLSDSGQCFGCVRFIHRSFPPDRQTHYEVLGLDRTATKEEIKAAYIKLGKEFHPDKLRANQDPGKRRTAAQAEEEHQHFVKINLAYSVLGKAESKREYDLGLSGLRDPVIYEDGKAAYGRSTRYYQPKDFNERAQHYGFHVDPNYKYHKSTTWIALGCFVFAFVGFIVHFKIAYMGFESQRDFLDQRHVRLSKEHKKVKEFAQSHESREANIEYLEKEMMKSRLYNEKRMEELVNRSPLESYTKPFGSTPDK